MQRNSTMLAPPAEPTIAIPDSIAFYRMRMVMGEWWFYLFPSEGEATHTLGPFPWPRAEQIIPELRAAGLSDS